MIEQSSVDSLPQHALVFDLEALYACFQRITDQRDSRGLQYPLASLYQIRLIKR